MWYFVRRGIIGFFLKFRKFKRKAWVLRVECGESLLESLKGKVVECGESLLESLKGKVGFGRWNVESLCDEKRKIF